jgi:hypothetical protein
MSNSSQYLRLIVCREIRTFYSVSEMLDCGHRFESEVLLADPLIAKRRSCAKCASLSATSPKKPAQSVRSMPTKEAGRRAS